MVQFIKEGGMAMRSGRIGFAFAVLLIAGLARAAPDPTYGILAGRVVDGELLTPIDGATVVVTASSRGSEVVVSGMTEQDGRFAYYLPEGTYDVLAIFGDARWLHRGLVVKAGQTTRVPGALAVGVEVVTIHEHAPDRKITPAAPVPSTVKRVPTYSDEAIDANYWGVGWMLLDVDDRGVVTGFRFLHRPDHGLDKVAEGEIWALRFVPARDGNGKPMASRVLWRIEWPAFHYAREVQLFGPGGQGALTPPLLLTDTGYQHPTLGDGFFLPHASTVPCRGPGRPMNMDSERPLYRDCSLPDLSRAQSEPLIPRPADR